MADHSNFEAFNAPKDETRALAFRVVQQSSLLWDAGKSRLRFDWAEPAGKTAKTAQYLYRNGALSPQGRFIAVDLRQMLPTVLHELEPMGACAVPVVTDFWGIFKDLMNDQVPAYARRIGIMVADLPTQLSNPELRQLVQLAIHASKRQCERIGEFLLVLNPTDIYDRGDTHEFWAWLSDLLVQEGFSGTPWTQKYAGKGGRGYLYFTPLCFGFEANAISLEWLK